MRKIPGHPGGKFRCKCDECKEKRSIYNKAWREKQSQNPEWRAKQVSHSADYRSRFGEIVNARRRTELGRKKNAEYQRKRYAQKSEILKRKKREYNKERYWKDENFRELLLNKNREQRLKHAERYHRWRMKRNRSRRTGNPYSEPSKKVVFTKRATPEIIQARKTIRVIKRLLKNKSVPH